MRLTTNSHIWESNLKSSSYWKILCFSDFFHQTIPPRRSIAHARTISQYDYTMYIQNIHMFFIIIVILSYLFVIVSFYYIVRDVAPKIYQIIFIQMLFGPILNFKRRNPNEFLPVDIWDKESIGLRKCTGWPFCDFNPRSWPWPS